MLTSISWLNRLLDPADLTPDEAVRGLETTSFPIESRHDLPDGDTRLDVEVTSNRGDCLCHVGIAREICAATGRKLLAPMPDLPRIPGGEGSTSRAEIENRVHDLCPRFTARVIKGVTVGPSPAWLVRSLESIGQRSINNIVDASNFVLFELGHPSHTFDLDTIDGGKLIVRHAQKGETLKALDAKVHKLLPTDLVVADSTRPVSLAGIIGGMDTGVSAGTRNILLEVATWNPPTVRRTARRLEIRTDAGYRFERIVDPRDLGWASDRLAQLILELAGGVLLDGMLDDGAPLPKQSELPLRLPRIEYVLGKAITAEEVTERLTAVGVEVMPLDSHTVSCRVPYHRPDLTREIDLIEEVARLHSLDNFEIAPRLEVPLDIEHPQDWSNREGAMDVIAQTLTSLGYFETVTFSFLPDSHARHFLPDGLQLLKVDEERRKGSPYLRPSIIPSLLTCRRANQDGQVDPLGGVRLFETASVFGEVDSPDTASRKTLEHRNLALMVDAGTKPDQHQLAIRIIRSAMEEMIHALAGPDHTFTVEPIKAFMPAMQRGSFAGVTIGDTRLGYFGVLHPDAIAPWGLDQTVAICELGLRELISLYPPTTRAHGLPAFPAIERDLSLVLEDATPWKDIESLVRELRLERLEACEFVGAYRGKQVGPGKKSLTLRMRFRDTSRTLRHEEVDPQVDRVIGEARSRLRAELRA